MIAKIENEREELGGQTQQVGPGIPHARLKSLGIHIAKQSWTPEERLRAEASCSIRRQVGRTGWH